MPCEGGRGAGSGGCPILAEHLPPDSHALRGGGWGGQELQAPEQLRPPRAKASRAARAPGGSTARCIQPGQQWPQEPWRLSTAPCPSSLGGWSGSSRFDKSAHCPLTLHGRYLPGWERPLTALVSSRNRTNHRISSLPRKPIITRVSASVTARWSLVCPLIGTCTPAMGCSRPWWGR